MSTRTIRVFTSRGAKETINTDATTWGDLKPLVEEHYDLTNLQPAESVNKTTLIHRDAKLPDGDFVLFLRPIKTKSGINYDEMTFSQLRGELSEDDKMEFQQQYGKNWTQGSFSQILEFLVENKNEGEPVANEEISLFSRYKEDEEEESPSINAATIKVIGKLEVLKVILEDIQGDVEEEVASEDLSSALEESLDQISYFIHDANATSNDSTNQQHAISAEEQAIIDKEQRILNEMQGGFDDY